MHACMHACMHAYIYPSIHPSIHTYIHTYIYIYILYLYIIWTTYDHVEGLRDFPLKDSRQSSKAFGLGLPCG